jgi:hypothetical protein
LVSNQLTEGVLREWQKDRDDTLNNLHEELRKCRQLLEGDQLDHVEWLYAKQDASEQKSYRECLSAVLSYGDAHARTFAVMNIPNKPLATLPDLELFHKSIEAALPVDLWIPQVTKSVILTDGAVSKDQKSGQLIPAPNLCNELFDAIVWNEAVRAYAELRARVPDFIIDPTTQKNLWKQDQTVRALGKKAQQCLTQQLSPTRFSAVVAQYRQSAVNLVTQLHTLTLGFLTEEYQRLWCNQPIVNSFDGLGTPKSWVIRSCFVAGPSYNASPNGQLTISPETIWYPGSTKIPWLGRLAIVPPDLLLLQQDVKALSASLAKQELLPSAALHMPQGSRTSSDLDALLYGLRGILALRTVLGQIEAPMSVGPPAIITAPSIQSKYDVKMCLARTHTGAIPAVDALKKCGSEVVDGCFAVTDSTPMSIFRYGRVCGGTEYVAWIPEHLNNSETFLHDHMENWSNQSLSTHTTAAMAFRNHGAPPDLTSAECGHPDGLCGGNYVYSLAIHGLAPDGTFSKDGLFKQAYPMRSVPANVDETFTLNQIQSTLEEIAPRFEGLIDNWLGYLDRKDHLLMPYYEDLNRAYIQLKIHTALHLQLSATPSDSVKAFFKAPLSGNDVQKAIKEHQLPPNFSSRLLLTNEDWRVPFPTVSRQKQ